MPRGTELFPGAVGIHFLSPFFLPSLGSIGSAGKTGALGPKALRANQMVVHFESDVWVTERIESTNVNVIMSLKGLEMSSTVVRNCLPKGEGLRGSR